MKKYLSVIILLFIFSGVAYCQGNSVYTIRPDDKEAHYFQPENYGLKANGKDDVSEALQTSINNLKKEKNYGILFIGEGKYLISKTIYIPPSIRLIGYGKKRPEIILADNAPGYDKPSQPVMGFFGFGSNTGASFMIFFTGNLVEGDAEPRDANAGTFYSALSNINLRIGKGNPYAAAMKTHYAQHGFISHCDIMTEDGFAGIVDIGNEMSDVRFFGGEYGIYTIMASPSWPMMLTDVYFEGQEKASIHSIMGGLTCVNVFFKNAPVAYEIAENMFDRVILDNCHFQNINEAAVIISQEDRAVNQVNILNSSCSNVPVLIKHRISGKIIPVAEKVYKVNEYSYGLSSFSMEDPSEFREIKDIEALDRFNDVYSTSVPKLPAASVWANVKDFGAKGDGETDDTEAIEKAISSADNIYFPQGWYVVSRTVKMNANTRFIGLHPYATQIVIKESTPFFSGFGGPVPVIETSEGGDNIYNGIGINTGANNYRAVGIKWMAGEGSYMNDVKFVGGHGNLHKGPRQGNDFGQLMARNSGMSTPSEPVYKMGPDLAWDTQYWSMWVTNNGGGTFKCIWTANTYASNGLFINNTDTPSKIYAISLEHHVRSELRMDNVSNWKIYDIQTEEEGREGPECVAMDLVNCQNLMFGNVFMMRVFRVEEPSLFSIRTWNCRDLDFYNIHNYGQNRYTANTALLDVNSKRNAPSWEMAHLTVSGEENTLGDHCKAGDAVEIFDGYRFAENLVSDSEGNVYFCELIKKAVYKYNPETSKITLFAEFPWGPVGLAMDTEDNLLVVVEYTSQPGLDEEIIGARGGFFGMGSTTMKVISMSTKSPDNTTVEIPRVPLAEISNAGAVWYPTSRCLWTSLDESIVIDPEHYFEATDGITYIADVGELARCSSLSRAVPLSEFYTTDENTRRLLKVKVEKDGTLSEPVQFASRGEFGWEVDDQGNIYIADGHIYIYDKQGNQTGVLEMPERPTSILFAGDDYSRLYVTSRNSFYIVKL